jgi:hypothetical protein
MIAKAQADNPSLAPPPGTTTTPPPTLLAGKYNTVDDLKKGIAELVKRDKPDAVLNLDGDPAILESMYKALESNIGRQQQQQPPKKDVDPSLQLTVPDTPPAPKLGAFEAAVKDVIDKGQVSDESYRKLKAMGLDKAEVDSYIEAKQFQATKAKETLVGLVGGEDIYKQLVEWAAQNFTDEEREAYNTAMGGGMAAAKLAVEGLHSRYTKANPQTPKVILGTQATDSGSAPFESWAQVTEAMRDPRYGKDPAYRASVERRMAASTKL